MEIYRLGISADAAETYRKMDLFERQFVYDLFENFKIGRALEGDYADEPEQDSPRRGVIVSNWAISFVVDRELKTVWVTSIYPADR
ncbi:MAG: hypothetical protein ACI8UO_005283 [Verrucomicrobiales bacterium]|jgi:hypothetical protein